MEDDPAVSPSRYDRSSPAVSTTSVWDSERASQYSTGCPSRRHASPAFSGAQVGDVRGPCSRRLSSRVEPGGDVGRSLIGDGRDRHERGADPARCSARMILATVSLPILSQTAGSSEPVALACSAWHRTHPQLAPFDARAPPWAAAPCDRDPGTPNAVTHAPDRELAFLNVDRVRASATSTPRLELPIHPLRILRTGVPTPHVVEVQRGRRVIHPRTLSRDPPAQQLLAHADLARDFGDRRCRSPNRAPRRYAGVNSSSWSP